MSASKYFRLRQSKTAFSLIEIAVVLAILSIILAGVVPYITEATKSADVNDTLERIERIELALAAYYNANGGLPCPADLTAAITATEFGRKAPALADDCDISGFGSVGNQKSALIAKGAVPNKDLGLPDEFAFDRWGRRLSYFVTLDSIDSAVPAAGSIIIHDASGAPRVSDALFAIVSHGPNGHGGATIGGTLFNAGSTNDEERQNCDCDTNPNNPYGAGTFGILVQAMKMPGASAAESFDDIVHYLPKDFFELVAAGGGP